jgi:hypothetical protein
MSEGMIQAVKWLVAIVVLGLVMVVTARWGLRELQSAVRIDASPAQEAVDELEEEPAAPLETGVASAVGAFTVTAGTVTEHGGETLNLSGGSGELVVTGFDPVAADAACLNRAALEVHLNEVVGAPTNIEVTAAAVPDVREIAADQDLGGIPVRLDTPSAPVAITDGSPGWLRWDVTPLYLQAAQGAPEGGSLAFAVGLTALEPPELSATFAGMADPEGRVPRLEWEALAGCAEHLGTPTD